MSTPIPQPDHTFLVLPFTPSIYKDPSPLPPIISQVVRSSDRSVLIIFSNPNHGEQLYTTLRRDPRASFAGLQTFLGRVYATMAEAQWRSGRVLMDVEVRFEGEDGDWREKLENAARAGKGQTVKLEGGSYPPSELTEGFEDLPMDPTLRGLLPPMITVLPCPPLPSASFDPPNIRLGPPVAALGGTFDHLHAAHKLLLHLALFLSTRRLIVGVMSDNLLSSKSNASLVQPLDVRIASVEAFLRRCGGGKMMDVLEIHDPLGPTAYEADIQVLVVSKETVSGGGMVNRVRREKELGELELFVVDVIAADERRDLTGEKDEGRLKELKMGSTGIRQWIRNHQ